MQSPAEMSRASEIEDDGGNALESASDTSGTSRAGDSWTSIEATGRQARRPRQRSAKRARATPGIDLMTSGPNETPEPRRYLPKVVLTMFRGALQSKRAHAAQRLEEMDTNSGLQSAQIERLQTIVDMCDTALERMSRGAFGICEICGRDISIERLEAVPYTRTCISCASVPPSLPRLGRTNPD
jgi:RNA polymerase-binding transcription factor DksA